MFSSLLRIILETLYKVLKYTLHVLFVPDVVSIEKTGENFRLLYDVKGRFTVHRITGEEAKVCYKKSCIQTNHRKFLP